MMSTAAQNNNHNNRSRNYVDKLKRHGNASLNPRTLNDVDRIQRAGRNPLKLSKDKEKKVENISRISFSHRAVALGALQASRDSQKMLERQLEINRISDYNRPMVHKLNPLQISQNIKMRSKLAKLMPKKDLQPKLYCSTNPLMQRQLQPIEPCFNYRQKHKMFQVDSDQPSRISIKEALNLKKQRELKASRFTETRAMEHTPATQPGIMAFAKAYYKKKKKQGKATNLLSPFNNFLHYAKGLTKAMRSDKER